MIVVAYDFELRKLAFRAAYDLHFEKGVLREGVYAYVSYFVPILFETVITDGYAAEIYRFPDQLSKPEQKLNS